MHPQLRAGAPRPDDRHAASNGISAAVKPVLLMVAAHYLPGFKAGGILRFVENMVNHFHRDFEFVIVTRDRDLGDNEHASCAIGVFAILGHHCGPTSFMEQPMKTDTVERRYRDGSYLAHNPDWDRSDSLWKALLVGRILKESKLSPVRICEVGCGAGEILVHLRKSFPGALLTGFDISPAASQFWKSHEGQGIQFHCDDFLTLNQQQYDCILLLDVIEHLANPFAFLEAIRERARFFVFHFPLDLSSFSVLREAPLLRQRKTVGHIHYFTKGLALALLNESGLDVMDWRYTNASLNGPTRTLKTRLGSLPRRLAYSINKDFGVRLLGGETLMVLAKAA